MDERLGISRQGPGAIRDRLNGVLPFVDGRYVYLHNHRSQQ